MDKPIGVGDLVQVVKPRPCCPEFTRYAVGLRVKRIFNSFGILCPYCRKDTGDVVAVELEEYPNKAVELFRLKRIPPLDELETVRTEDEVPA